MLAKMRVCVLGYLLFYLKVLKTTTTSINILRKKNRYIIWLNKMLLLFIIFLSNSFCFFECNLLSENKDKENYKNIINAILAFILLSSHNK